jgi:transcriptional regulator with XRE-family HTH domain
MLLPLRLKRLEKGLTQYELHLISGVTHSRISYGERGFPCLTLNHKEKLAKALGLRPQDIFPESKGNEK